MSSSVLSVLNGTYRHIAIQIRTPRRRQTIVDGTQVLATKKWTKILRLHCLISTLLQVMTHTPQRALIISGLRFQYFSFGSVSPKTADWVRFRFFHLLFRINKHRNNSTEINTDIQNEIEKLSMRTNRFNRSLKCFVMLCCSPSCLRHSFSHILLVFALTIY
jgi:hypothetical protein